MGEKDDGKATPHLCGESEKMQLSCLYGSGKAIGILEGGAPLPSPSPKHVKEAEI
jgi:hypothetical protein